MDTGNIIVCCKFRINTLVPVSYLEHIEYVFNLSDPSAARPGSIEYRNQNQNPHILLARSSQSPYP